MNDNKDLSLRLKTAECEQEKLLEELFDIKTSLSLIGEKSKQKKISEELLEIKNKIGQLKTKCAESKNNRSNTTLDIDQGKYVVCLMFSKLSPPEWAGNRWRVSGKGKCYSTSEQAYQCLQQLRQKWPDYPIEILKR
ncbi:hypothetical protein QUF74_08635 [Candidatus Halobeggiatoa sp. HSG11]|nr:hypothetical protein [Candidatus Halobeggiatoa sp. HSG11]